MIVGVEEEIAHPDDGEAVRIERKFYGDERLVERATITQPTLAASR